MLTFIWIADNTYNLLDAHLHNLPRQNWVEFPGNKLRCGTHVAEYAGDYVQPSNPYLHIYRHVPDEPYPSPIFPATNNP